MIARLSPLVRVVRAPNPSPLTLEGTNTYVVGSRATIVIDPGPDDEEHLFRVLEQSSVPSVILLTHRHADHSAGARRFAVLSGAPLASYAGDGARVGDGERIHSADVTLHAMHTPGHSSDHLSFRLEQEGAVFTGDHVLGRGTTVVAHPDGDMVDYLASLERLRAAAPSRLYPGHGPVVDDPGPVLDHYVGHRLERERQVLDAIDAGCATPEQMVERIYADYDRALWGAAALSVRAHLTKLAREGVVREEGGRWLR